MTYAKIQSQGILGLEKKIFKGFFTIYGHGGLLGQWTATILAILHSPNLRRLHMKLEQNWPRGSRGGRLKFWIFFPYKCIRKQNRPQGKKVKCQCTTIILASLGDLQFPMIYVKIQPQGILGFGEQDFKRFFPYKCIGKQTWPCRKKRSNVNIQHLF